MISQAVRKVVCRFDGSEDDLGQMIGCDGSTVNNAINQRSELSAHSLLNLLNVDPYALEGLLGHYGRRSVPIEAKCDTDEMVPLTKVINKLAEARSRHATEGECLELEPDIEAAMDALLSLQSRCTAIRKARA